MAATQRQRERLAGLEEEEMGSGAERDGSFRTTRTENGDETGITMWLTGKETPRG